MSDLDITDFLKEGALSDLDWLEVTPEDYRALETLPKQNLDYAPDLEALWDHQDKPASFYHLPNKHFPERLSDLSDAHTKKASDLVGAQVVRVARLACMQHYKNPAAIQNALKTKFPLPVLRSVQDDLQEVFSERGLLGPYYIDAFDFPECSGSKSKNSVDFVRRYAASSKYVLAKEHCADCVHNTQNRCSVFHKQIVLDVPYTSAIADQVTNKAASSGKHILEGLTEPKERIRLALLSDDQGVTKLQANKPVEATQRNLRPVKAAPKVHLPVISNARTELQKQALSWNPKAISASVGSDRLAFEVVQKLRQEMLTGAGEEQIVHTLKLAFSTDDLRRTRQHWEPYFKQAGLYGTVFTTQDSFDSCNVGADYLAKTQSSVKAVVAGDKCTGCIYNKLARCMMYGRPLVASAEDLYTPDMVASVVADYRRQGKTASSVDASLAPVEQLQQLYRTATGTQTFRPVSSTQQAFYGNRTAYRTSDLALRSIRKKTACYMNEGLYGKDLVKLLSQQFDPRDLAVAHDTAKYIEEEQGLQGVYYVDPQAYDDYGKGCDTGANLYRSKNVPYLKVGSKCDSCVHQSRSGHCSKYNKALVVEPLYVDKRAQQQEVLSTGASTENDPAFLIKGSKNLVAEFGLAGRLDQIELDNVSTGTSGEISLGRGSFKL